MRNPLVAAYHRAVNDDPTRRTSTIGPLDRPEYLAQCLACGEQATLVSSLQAVLWHENHACQWLT